MLQEYVNAAIKDNNCLVINAVPRLSSLITRGQILNAFLKLGMTKMADCKNFMVNFGTVTLKIVGPLQQFF